MATNLFHPSFMGEISNLFFQHTCTIQKMTAGAIDAVGQYSAATWANDQTGVTCVFYYLSPFTRFDMPNYSVTEETLIVVLPSSVTIAETGYRIVSINPGFVGTFNITKLRGEDMGNWIATLEKVPE